MRTGTRRMWARRVLRAGWLMAPILSFPNWLYRFMCVDRDSGKFHGGKTFWCLVFWGFVGLCIIGVRHNNRVFTTATPEEVAAAIKDNYCMKHLMPIWQTHFARPLQVADLDRGIVECKIAMDNYNGIEAQKKAMGVK